MNSTNSSDSNGTKNYFINFNQDSTSLAVGCKTGYRLFSLSSVDHLEQIYSNGTEDSCLVERLFSSSLVAVVSLAAPRKLKVCHFKKGTEICNYSYSNTILAVKLNRARLVVCLEESLYIHNIRDMKVLHTIRDTPPNPLGLCALSINSECSYLAYSGSSTNGEVQIFDAVNLNAKSMIHAHNSPLAALAFSPNGEKLATASERGTVIRVFSVIDSLKLFEFRRGVKRCVSISCIAFSMCGRFVSCSSNTETVHIFRLEEPRDSPRRSVEESTWMGYLTTYLPSQVTDVFNQGRAFATAHLPIFGVRNAISIATIQQQLRLLVATEDGDMFVYNLDSDLGGDLVLYKQHRLDAGPDVTPKGTEKPDGANRTVSQSIEGGILGSYAGIVKGNPMGQMSGTVWSCYGTVCLCQKSVNQKRKVTAEKGFVVMEEVEMTTSKTIFEGGKIDECHVTNFPSSPSSSRLSVDTEEDKYKDAESDKFREMAAATESPPKDAFQFSDDQEYPPLTQNSD